MENKQTVLIVGASRGLGLALAEEYCKRGFQVIATVRQRSTALEDFAKEIFRKPGNTRRGGHC